MNKKEIFYFQCWNKGMFTFKSSDNKRTLEFQAYYRSSIGKTITIASAIKEGCDYIYLNGESIE